MKTNFRFLALSAAILSMFTACQREELEQNQKPEVLTHSVTFVAGAPETKTTATIDGNTVNYAWTADDENRIFVYENGEAATKKECVLADGVMTIKATFEGSTTPENASYVAVVNKSNATQIMSAEAYDEDADILVSKALSSFDGETGVQLQFKREVAIAKMTLKGLDVGEVVNIVTVSSTADIAGSYGVDGWASPAASSIDISSTFAMEVGDYKIVANKAGEAVVWFTCIPQTDATLTVKVVAADGDTYTKEFSQPITLTRGDVKAFGVAMTKDVVVKPWVAVDLADIDETMPLVITMATTDKTYALSLTGTDGNALGTSKAPKAIEVSVVDGKLSEEPSSDILWNIANNNGNLTIYPNGVTNEWLYTTNNNDGVRLGNNTSNGYVWSIDATSGYLKANATTSIVRYLGVYQGKDWRAYTLSSGNIASNIANQTLRFYSNSITEDPKAPKLSVTPTSKTWASVETDAAVFNVTTNTEGEKDWKVSPETLGWATIVVNKTAGTITVTPKDANTTKIAREATLTVTHAADASIYTEIKLKQNGTGEDTIEIKYKDIPSGYASSGTSGTFEVTTTQNATITVGYGGLNTKSSNGKAYSYTMFVKNAGYMYSNTALDGYYVKSVTANFSSGTGTSGKVGVTFTSTISSSRNANVSDSVSQSGSITATNEDTNLKYWNLSSTTANVQIVSVVVVYAPAN